jgi:hypothetical protein
LFARRWNETKVSIDKKIHVWLGGDVDGKLKQVPGIHDAEVEKLAADNVEESECITSTHQLIGKYLMLYEPDKMTSTDLNKKFSHFLQERGITLHRPHIVRAISEKVASFFPGFHDGSKFNEDDYK